MPNRTTGPVPARSEMVLIVDDEIDIRNSLADILKDEGIRAMRARSGKDALARLEKNTAAIVVLDILMSDDGIEAAAQIQRKYSDTSIIFLTAYDNEANHHRALEAGVRAARWVDKLFDWHKKASSAVLEIIHRSRVMEHLKMRLGEVRAGYRDVAARHLAWKVFREAIIKQLWEAYEELYDDKYKRQIADQLSEAVSRIEAHQLLSKHLEIVERSFEKLASNEVGSKDVHELGKAWEQIEVHTLPSFSKILKEWEDLYSVEDEAD